ncbi:MAG TPA: ferredoxin-type protein NapF [Sedimenticola sp.]|nr:ferredoxin-type protein NapF [Sedimenticola sp.]
MAGSISRMQFLRGDFKGEIKLLRPPWAIPEALFIETCSGCGECIKACPASILKPGRAKLPEVDFSGGGCDFCGDCKAVCETGALSQSAGPGRSPWTLKAHFEDACLARQGMACYTCQESCDMDAIRLRLVVGGVSAPQLVSDACNGCGDCYAPCPVGAVSMRPQPAQS